jgi:hypothetical protein
LKDRQDSNWGEMKDMEGDDTKKEEEDPQGKLVS